MMDRHRRVYDNWARLVESTLNRDHLRQLARCPSIASDTTTTASSFLGFPTSATAPRSAFNFRINSISSNLPAYLDHHSMAKPILLASYLVRAAEAVSSYSEPCLDLHSQATKLADLVGKAELAAHELYDRPTRYVMHDTCFSLCKALDVVLKCRRKSIPANDVDAAAFSNASARLDNSTRNLCWLLRVEEDLQSFPPPVSLDEPTLCEVWELIATLCTGSIEDQCNAAASLVRLAIEDDFYRNLIVQEGGIRPLLRFLRDLKSSQEINGKKHYLSMALLGVESRIRTLFDILLRTGPMKDRDVAAPLLAELTAAQFGKSTVNFEPAESFMLLVDHLEFDHFTNANSNMNEMTVTAIWSLARGNSMVCRSMKRPSTLLGFAALLADGPEPVRYYSATALLKVTAAAEKDRNFRKSVFKLNSPARRAVVEQLFRIIRDAKTDSDLLIPCVGSIGNLARNFETREARKIISELVNLLDVQEADVSREACVALTKLARVDNFARPYRSRAIVSAGGAKRLVGLVYRGGQRLQRCALMLLCHIALRVPQCSELVDAEVLGALAWASGKWILEEDDDGKKLLPKSMYRLEWYWSKGWEEDTLQH